MGEAGCCEELLDDGGACVDELFHCLGELLVLVDVYCESIGVEVWLVDGVGVVEGGLEHLCEGGAEGTDTPGG